MATKSQEILLKGNTTNASAVPSSLKVREIAINTLDRSLFTNDGNSIVKLYTGTTKWFDVNGNANNALKLGGVLASEYINKEAFNSHINNSIIHITADERIAWNAKWDYNEETIKAVKVNAAVSADKLTSNAGTSAIPIYFKNGKPAQCIPSDLFSGFDNAYSSTKTSLGITIAGHTRMVVVAYSTLAGSATKLETARKIWGKYFDGLSDISGDLTDVGNITASGKATIQGDIISGGEVVAVAGEGTPAGVTDYSALTGKPSINGVTLVSGNNTLAALGIQAAGDYATISGVTTLLADYAKKTFVANNYAGKAAFNSHTADTDIHITAAERNAWNAKWDYNEATIKAVKVTSASSADSVAWTGIKDKPTTFTPSAHTHTASDVSGLPKSLKNPYALTFGSKTYDGSAAKTITASDLGALTAHQTIYALTLQVNGTSQGVYKPASAAKTINIAVPTKTSQITNDSGFITNAAIPTALKNPYAVEIKANGVSLGTYDGSKAATFNLSAANVGAANKVHSHTASEISGLPTNLSAFNNDVGYITGITKSMVEGVLTGDITSHTHSFTSLTSKPTTIAGYGITDALTTSNYNSYAPTLTGIGASGTWGINISGNAATVGGIVGSITAVTDTNTGYWGYLGYGRNRNLTLGSNYGGVAWHAQEYCADLMFGCELDTHGFISIGFSSPMVSFAGSNNSNASNDNPNWYFKLTGTSGTIYNLNCAPAATKLQTPRTIWGQNFDGTSDVNGDAHIIGDLVVDGEVSALIA